MSSKLYYIHHPNNAYKPEIAHYNQLIICCNCKMKIQKLISYKSKYVKHSRKSFKINRFHQHNISNTFHADKKKGAVVKENEILYYTERAIAVLRG